jgi:hypothetical protein
MATYQYTPMPATEGPQVVSIADMINTARGAQALRASEQAYQQAERTNPLAVSLSQEQVKQSQIKSEVDQFGFQQKKFKQIADSQISMINNPLIVAAEQDPNSVSKDQLKQLIYQNGMDVANAHGIPKEQAISLMQPYMKIADENPGSVRTFFKQRLMQGADDATKIGAMQPSGSAVSTGAGGYQLQSGEFGAQPRGTVLPGTQFNTQLGPGQRMEATGEVDINNNPIFNVKDANGRVVGQTTVQGNVPQNQMPAPPPMPAAGTQPGVTAQPGGVTQMRQQLQPAAAAAPVTQQIPIARIPAGQSAKTGEAYLAEAIQSRNSVQPAKIGLQNIDTVLKYLPLAQTGKYSEAVQGLQSVLGNVAGSKPDEIAAAARNTITKTINDLAIQKNAALSGKFASSLEAAQSSLASAEMNPTAIAKSMEQLRPILQNINNYSVGLDKAIEKSPIKQYVKPEFDAAFNDAFDPSALSFKSAFEQGKDLKKYAKENNISLVEQEKLLNKIQAYDYLTNGDLAGYKAFMASLNRRR